MSAASFFLSPFLLKFKLIDTKGWDMVAFEQNKIVVTINGDKEDYAGLIKAVLFMMGNQNPEMPPDSDTLFSMCNLLNAMMPGSDQLI
jgi:hypothetical protein